MTESKSLAHSKWECQYHIVFIPKYRRKVLYERLRKHLGEIFHQLVRQRESVIVEGHLMADHVHMLVEIPPKYAVAKVIGFLKGKSAIQIAHRFEGVRRHATGHKFWARGYWVSTVGRDEEQIRKYIREQEAEDRLSDQLDMFDGRTE